MDPREYLEAAARRGEWADFRHHSGAKDVDADFIRQLLVLSAEGSVLAAGVRVRGAKISGQLDLSDCGSSVAPLRPLVLDECEIDQPLLLQACQIERLSLMNTELEGIDATEAKILGSVVIRGIRPRKNECRVILWGAHIAGSLEADAIKLVAPYGKQALEATLCRVDGSVHFRNQCQVQGQIRLQNASIGKTLDFSGGRYTNPYHIAISIERSTIGSSVILREETAIEGRLSAIACSIGGNVELVGASFTKAYPIAINLGKASVAGNIIVSQWKHNSAEGSASVAEGDIRLGGVSCQSDIVFDGVVVRHNPPREDYPLIAGVDMEDAKARSLRLRSLQLPVGGTLSLKGVRVDVLDDDLSLGYGEASTKLVLAGLRYDQLASPDGNSKRGLVRGRLTWLRRQGRRFNPDGYRQLAQALSRQGYFEDARRIRIAEKLHELFNRTPWPLKPFGFLFWAGFEFGYSSTRALATLAVSVCLGWLGVTAAENQRALVVDTTTVASVSSQSGEIGISIANQREILRQPLCGDSIDPLYFALDLMVPVVDFHQEQKCEVSGADRFFAWRLAKNLYVLWGWIVVSLALFTFSSAIARSREEPNS